MAEQEQKRRQPAKERPTEEAAPESDAASTERGDRLKADLDELLDEIDEVLEDNAEEFVRNYVQKGGE
jgi:ubiquitin-like protein Pup